MPDTKGKTAIPSRQQIDTRQRGIDFQLEDTLCALRGRRRIRRWAGAALSLPRSIGNLVVRQTGFFFLGSGARLPGVLVGFLRSTAADRPLLGGHHTSWAGAFFFFFTPLPRRPSSVLTNSLWASGPALGRFGERPRASCTSDWLEAGANQRCGWRKRPFSAAPVLASVPRMPWPRPSLLLHPGPGPRTQGS